MTFLASAPAKVILFGEHFVVENEPAIAAALDLRVEVSVNLLDEKRFEIRSGNLFSFVRLDDLLSNHYSVNQHLKPLYVICLLYTSPSPRDAHESRMPSSA